MSRKSPVGVTCIILAAGLSRRFGSNKMAYQLHDGRTLLMTTIELYQLVFSEIIVVVSAKLKASLEPLDGVKFVSDSRSQHGLSQSLVAGLEASSKSAGWLIALGDMPYIKVETIRALISQAAPKSIVAPVLEQGEKREAKDEALSGIGNPVVFGQSFYSDLITLTGDRGARGLIQRYPDCLVLVSTSDDGVVSDIDSPDQVRSR